MKETNPTALLLQLVPNQLTAKIKATLANQKGKKIKKNQNSIPQITDHETISAQKNKKEDQKNNSTTIPLILKPKGTDWKEIISSQQSFQLEKKKKPRRLSYHFNPLQRSNKIKPKQQSPRITT